MSILNWEPFTSVWRRPSLTRELGFPFRAAGSAETPLINRLQLIGTIIYNQVELRFRTVPFRNHYFKATLLHAAKHVDHCCVMIGDIESGCGAHPGIADFLMIVFPQDAANEMWFT